MEYWLINYNSPCPAGWTADSGDCFRNSNAVNVPSQSITNLINLSVTGQAVSGGNDTMMMPVGGTIYSVTGPDSVIYLANGWTASEFNIVGDCCFSQANFNSGSTIVVRTSVDYGSNNAPACAAEGFTGETNNLNFGTPPTAISETFPAVVFTESTSGSAPSPCASATEVGGGGSGSNPASTHDFNGDGMSDVLWRDTAGNVGLWLMKGTQILQGSAFSSVPLSWAIVGQRDFNGDGKADILWRDTAGDVGLWLMNGTQIVQGGAFSAVPLNWSIAGTGDFNADGKADILWLDNQNNVGIWFMNGTQILQGGVVGQMPANWTVVGSDMKGDIFLRNVSTGGLAMWVMKGTQVVQAVDLGPLPKTWFVAGIGDFDGNGSFDILLRDTSGNVQVWLMSGTLVLSKAMLGNVPTSWSIAETGDFNGDGKSDILWVDNVGNVGVWIMNGTTISQGYAFGNVGTAWRVQSLNAD